MYILSSVKTLGQPIKIRFQESEERPKLFEELGKQIQQYMKVISSFKNKVSFFPLFPIIVLVKLSFKTFT